MAGQSSVQAQDLNKFCALLPGDPADGNKIQSFWETVRAAYAQLGYLDAAVNPVPKFDDQAKRVTYSVAVTEGPQYHMGKLVLTGLSVEGERRLKKAWTVPPGAVFDKSIYDDFVNTGIKASFCRSARPLRENRTILAARSAELQSGCVARFLVVGIQLYWLVYV